MKNRFIKKYFDSLKSFDFVTFGLAAPDGTDAFPEKIQNFLQIYKSMEKRKFLVNF